MSLFTKSFVIDLGTSTTQVYKRGEGVVLDEPSVVAVDRLGGKILAVGNSAKAMAEKTPDSVIIINPLTYGVVSDYDMTRSMLKVFFQKCPPGLTKPRVTVIASSAASDVEKRAVKEAFMGAGAKSVAFVNKSIASALVAGISPDEGRGCMVIDIGGGTTELAFISFGRVISSKSIKFGGNAFDEAIKDYVRKNHGVVIGSRVAEQIKISLKDISDGEKIVNGRDVKTGLPKGVILCGGQIKDSMRGVLLQIADAASVMLEQAPVDLVSDIKERGIFLTGGGARLWGICEFLSDVLNIPVQLSQNENIAECYESIIGVSGGEAL